MFRPPKLTTPKRLAAAGTCAGDSVLRFVVNAGDDYYFVVEPEGGRAFVSPAYLRASGFTPDEIRSTDFRTRIHHEDLPLVERARQENLNGMPTKIAYRSLRKDGSVLRLELRACPILSPAGRLEHILCRSREVRRDVERTQCAKRAAVRILIVDDHAVWRLGLRRLLEAQGDMDVVGEAGNAEQAMKSVAALAPDVVTLDLSLPDESGLKTLEKLRTAHPKCRVLVLTMHDDVAYMRSTISAGGGGFLSKTAESDEVVEAVRSVAADRRCFAPQLDARLVRALIESATASAPDICEPVTARERSVLVLVARGYTNREIAAQLSLSIKSIEIYRAGLMAKLGFDNRAQLVRFALMEGLLS